MIFMDIIYDYFPAQRFFTHKEHDPFVCGLSLRVEPYDYFPALHFFTRKGYAPFVSGNRFA